jgi:hypothetical protein
VGGFDMDEAYNRDTVTGRPVFRYDVNESVRRIYSFDTTNPLSATALLAAGRSEVSSDVDGTNVVLRIGFNSINSFPTATPAGERPVRWLEEITDQEVFKRNFKIVSRSGTNKTLNGLGTAGNGVRAVEDLVYIGINRVTYGRSRNLTDTNLNEIVIYLDPSYVYQNTPKYFIIAPGFRYTDELITLGDYTNWDFDINGVKYWRWGGALPVNF